MAWGTILMPSRRLHGQSTAGLGLAGAESIWVWIGWFRIPVGWGCLGQNSNALQGIAMAESIWSGISWGRVHLVWDWLLQNASRPGWLGAQS